MDNTKIDTPLPYTYFTHVAASSTVVDGVMHIYVNHEQLIQT